MPETHVPDDGARDAMAASTRTSTTAAATAPTRPAIHPPPSQAVSLSRYTAAEKIVNNHLERLVRATIENRLTADAKTVQDIMRTARTGVMSDWFAQQVVMECSIANKSDSEQRDARRKSESPDTLGLLGQAISQVCCQIVFASTQATPNVLEKYLQIRRDAAHYCSPPLDAATLAALGQGASTHLRVDKAHPAVSLEVRRHHGRLSISAIDDAATLMQTLAANEIVGTAIWAATEHEHQRLSASDVHAAITQSRGGFSVQLPAALHVRAGPAAVVAEAIHGFMKTYDARSDYLLTQYVFNGCQSRCHLMTSALRGHGMRAAKISILPAAPGTLKQGWRRHIAPLIFVSEPQGGMNTVRAYVLDPAVAPQAPHMLSIAAWLGACVEKGTPQVLIRGDENFGGADEAKTEEGDYYGYVETALMDLEAHRLDHALQGQRSKGKR